MYEQTPRYYFAILPPGWKRTYLKKKLSFTVHQEAETRMFEEGSRKRFCRVFNHKTSKCGD